MKLLFILCAFFMALLPAFAVVNPDPGKPGLPNKAAIKYYLNRGYGFSPQLGTEITDHKIQLAKGQWNMSTQGGASVVLPTTVLANLVDVDGKDLQIPYHAIIKKVMVDVLTAPVASGATGYDAPYMGLGINTAGDLLGYRLATGWTAGIHDGIPQGMAGSAIKVTGGTTALTQQGSTIKVNMYGGSVVGGKINVFIEYYLSD